MVFDELFIEKHTIISAFGKETHRISNHHPASAFPLWSAAVIVETEGSWEDGDWEGEGGSE